MTDPLTTKTHAEALEDLLAAAQAMIDTCGEICTQRQTRLDPAEYAPTHEAWAEGDLKRSVLNARALLDAECAA